MVDSKEHVFPHIFAAITYLETHRIPNVKLIRRETSNSHLDASLPARCDRLQIKFTPSDTAEIDCQIVFDSTDYSFPPDIIILSTTVPCDPSHWLIPVHEWNIENKKCLYNWIQSIASSLSEKFCYASPSNYVDDTLQLAEDIEEPEDNVIWLAKEDDEETQIDELESDSDYQDNGSIVVATEKQWHLTDMDALGARHHSQDIGLDLLDTDEEAPDQTNREQSPVSHKTNFDAQRSIHRKRKRRDTVEDVGDTRVAKRKHSVEIIALSSDEEPSDMPDKYALYESIDDQTEPIMSWTHPEHFSKRRRFMNIWLNKFPDNLVHCDAELFTTLTLYISMNMPPALWQEMSAYHERSKAMFPDQRIAKARPVAPVIVKFSLDASFPSLPIVHILLISAINTLSDTAAKPVMRSIDYRVKSTWSSVEMVNNIWLMLADQIPKFHSQLFES